MDDRKCRGPAKKTPLPTVVLLISVAMATGQIMPNDPNCLSKGGICAAEGSCPSEVLDSDGNIVYCNEDPESVCCQTVPEGTNCRENGGRCGGENECKNVRRFGQLDCPKAKQCCLLIF